MVTTWLATDEGLAVVLAAFVMFAVLSAAYLIDRSARIAREEQ